MVNKDYHNSTLATGIIEQHDDKKSNNLAPSTPSRGRMRWPFMTIPADTLSAPQIYVQALQPTL